MEIFITAVICLLIGIGIGYFFKHFRTKKEIEIISSQNQDIKENIEKEKKDFEKELRIEFKEKLLEQRQKLEDEFKSVRKELTELEKKLSNKEQRLDQRSDTIEKKSEELNKEIKNVETKSKKLDDIYNQQLEKLEKIAGLSSKEAKEQLIKQIEKEAKHDAVKYIKKYEEEAKRIAEKQAKKIVTFAIQRCAADVVAENSVTTVTLNSDDMKGRIIGREGRNIREFEKCTGVDLIIDDTPEVVIISSFDSLRREVARLSLEKLLIDGRIHPTRIEEIVNKTKKELSKSIIETGESAVLQVGVHGISEEEIKYLGKLKYRSSYGQNVLQHSIEVANLAGIMASELGANVQLAKKMGLLHDIGKSVDQENEGTHARLGAELLKKSGQPDVVIHAIAAHHGEVPFKTVEGVLIAAADAISAARPGARKENIESYIKRLQELEGIAENKDHVEKAYALQAGREVRVIVMPEKINDTEMEIMAREIAKEVEEKLEYPGQIKITVIRESRSVSYAK